MSPPEEEIIDPDLPAAELTLLTGRLSRAGVAEPLWTKGFVLLMAVSVLYWLGFQLVLVSAPLLAVKLGGGNASAGLVMGSFTFAAMLVRPVTGWALDAYGRRALLVMGTAVCLVAILAHEFASGVLFLLLLRSLHGAGFGTATTALGTLASDLVPRSRLGEGMGLYTMAMSVPLAVAPAVGLGLVAGGDFTILFLLAGGLTALSLTLASVMRTPRRERSGVGIGLSSLTERTALFPASMMLLLAITYGPLIAFIAIYGQERGIANVGSFFTAYAIVLAVARPLSGRLADRYGYEPAAAVGMLLAAIGMVTLAVAQGLGGLLLAAVLYGIGFGTAQPSLQAVVIYRVPPARRGAATAAFYTALDLGMVIGSIAGGFMAAIVALSGVYLVSAGVAMVAFAFLVVFIRRNPSVSGAGM
ncbi:MAG: MFS transporter [Thermoleophilia bacterium]